jgi:hypothetical protein
VAAHGRPTFLPEFNRCSLLRASIRYRLFDIRPWQMRISIAAISLRRTAGIHCPHAARSWAGVL